MQLLTKYEYAAVEKILYNYPYLDNKIYKREQELLHKWRPYRDSNKGYRAENHITKPTEGKGVLLADDKYLRQLRAEKETVDEIIREMEERDSRGHLDLMKAYYFDKRGTDRNTYMKLLNIEKSTFYTWKRAIIEFAYIRIKDKDLIY